MPHGKGGRRSLESTFSQLHRMRSARAILLERRALQYIRRLAELVVQRTGRNESKAQIKPGRDRVAVKASELHATALRIALRYRAQRLDRRGAPVPSSLETMVNHDVVDPIVGFARRIADNRREADNLIVGLDNLRRVLEIVAPEFHITSRERPSRTRHPGALLWCQFEQHHRVRIGAIDFNQPDDDSY